jgi:DNA-binding MarR family transcriptional regulator
LPVFQACHPRSALDGRAHDLFIRWQTNKADTGLSHSQQLAEPGPDPLDGFVLEDHIGFWLRRVALRHAHVFQETLAGHELTAPQYAALSKTVELGRVTQNRLGRMTAMDPATIQGVVKRLIDRGLIARTSDPLDRRTAVLVPTASGSELITATVALARRSHAAVLAPLSETEQQQLIAMLRRMV